MKTYLSPSTNKFTCAQGQFAVKSLSASGEFQGYASVFDVVDQQGDIVEKGAFKNCLEKAKVLGSYPKLLWQHDQKKPIGRILELREDGHGLFIRAQLLLEVKQAKEAYALLKSKAIEGMSIGYRVIRSIRDSKVSSVRRLLKLDLLEVSLVTFAANPRACITDVKSAEISEAEAWLAADIHRLAAIIRGLTFNSDKEERHEIEC
ncbi:MAG: HK97 family phage prohead protease [Holosporales bacterium]|jgi:HK97 family phage prohead protease|nr:HK97 family phage prohead protease [Holosporales bacterium]